MNPSFWHNKKVLITGHTGFKGSWISLWLKSLGAEIIGFSLPPPTSPSLYDVVKLSSDINSFEGDVRNLDQLKLIIQKHRPGVIIHMAAQSLVRYSYDNPIETYATNVMGTVNILEAVRQSDCVRVILNVTSDKCYENQEWLWGYRETEPMGGYDPYSSSKGCAELVTKAYMKSYFSCDQSNVVVASVRAGNVIGGGDWATDRLIPDVMTAFMGKRPVLIRYPNAIRPWQHVLEPLSGYLTLLEYLWTQGEKYSGAWNFGPSDEDVKTVSWVVKHLADTWHESASWKIDSEEKHHEANYLKLDSSKARSQLGWRPKLNISTALEWVTSWYGAYHTGENMRDLTEKQIRAYQGKITH